MFLTIHFITITKTLKAMDLLYYTWLGSEVRTLIHNEYNKGNARPLSQWCRIKVTQSL